MERRISLITLGVSDLESSARFYEALGWSRVETPDDGIVAFDLLGQVLGLYPLAALASDLGLPAEALGRGAMTLGYNAHSTDAADAVMAAAKSAGAKVLKPMEKVFWGGYSGYFADPDGHIWEVAHNPFSTLGPDGAFRWGGY